MVFSAMNIVVLTTPLECFRDLVLAFCRVLFENRETQSASHKTPVRPISNFEKFEGGLTRGTYL